jgi:uncharacterized sulfatase
MPLRLLALLLVLLAPAVAHAQERPPNVLLLIGDDLGWPYAGFMGDPVVRTPNLDALASQGTTFVNTHSTASVCVPALRTLLGGVHSEQWERQRSTLAAALGPLPLRAEVQLYRTVPRELARVGYLAWEGGKLWEGTFASAGFTHGLATSISPDLFTSVGDDFGRTGWSDGTALAPLQDFLDEAGDRPFFLWVAPKLPHVPYDAPAEFVALYAGLGLDPLLARYYANVSWLDALAGAVLAELDARGLRDDTLVLFLSDNGKDATQDLAGTGHGKGTLYELGFRQPMILRWPGRVPAGATREDLVSTLDVAATVLDYAGADALDDGGGTSLRSAVETGAPVGHDRLVSRYRGGLPSIDGAWVRTTTWRYLAAADGREELYAIDVDPFEQVNVAPLRPDLLPGFRSDVLDWTASIAAGRAELDVAGRITDPLDAPLAGESVELSGRSAAGARIRLRALSSARGDFLFESVPIGSYVLRSRRGSARLGFRNASNRIPVPLRAGSLDLFLPLRGAQAVPAGLAGDATLRGRVVDGAGQPIAGATVALAGNRGGRKLSVVLRTAADGTYRAEWLHAGDYQVRIRSTAPRRNATADVSLGAADDRVLDVTLPG